MFARLILSKFLLVWFGLVWFGLVWAGETIEEILDDDRYTDEYVEAYFGEYLSVIKEQPKPGDRLNLDVGEFEVVSKLGEGWEAYVYEVAPVSNPGERMALKLPKLEKNDYEHLRDYVKAQKILQQVNDEHVIKLMYPESKLMIMEKADGSLRSLSKLAATSEEAKILFKRVMKNVIDAMEYLYTNEIEFYDLQIDNIVYFVKGNQVKFKLIDIGISDYNSEGVANPRLMEELKGLIQECHKELSETLALENADTLIEQIKEAKTPEQLKNILGIDQEELSVQEQIAERVLVEKIKQITQASGGNLDDTLQQPSSSADCR